MSDFSIRHQLENRSEKIKLLEFEYTEQHRALYSEMETIRLVFLLIVAATLSPHILAAYPSPNPSYYHPKAPPNNYGHVQEVPLRGPAMVVQETVGCSYHAGFARNFCWTYGCNSNAPDDWCWLPVYCGGDAGICEDFKQCIQNMPCTGSCS